MQLKNPDAFLALKPGPSKYNKIDEMHRLLQAQRGKPSHSSYWLANITPLLYTSSTCIISILFWRFFLVPFLSVAFQNSSIPGDVNPRRSDQTFSTYPLSSGHPIISLQLWL